MGIEQQIGQAVEQRLNEGQSGRLRALLAAGVAGVASAVATYKLLRGDGPH